MEPNTTGNESRGLERIKAQMSPVQRREMSEIIQAELRRREQQKVAGKGSLEFDDLREIYSETGRKLQARREAQTGRKASTVPEKTDMRGSKSSLLSAAQSVIPKRLWVPTNKLALMLGVILLAGIKIVLSAGQVTAERGVTATNPATAASQMGSNEDVQSSSTSPSDSADTSSGSVSGEIVLAKQGLPPSSARARAGWSAEDKELLTQLDARRVELEKRREMLDAREGEIKAQAQALSERVAELRSLTGRVSQSRQAVDLRHEERLEQLANVYGSMQPKEAAPLIAKLEDQIALSLLERMPAKRLGQILSLMESERAIELTKQLTDRKQVN